MFETIFRRKIPRHILNKYIQLKESDVEYIQKSLIDNYFSNNLVYLSTERGKNDLADHLFNRLNNMRYNVIPWIDNTMTLDGSSILEIGCGTGCSIVAFAEQGANVTGIDIDRKALKVAEDRCNKYGVEASIIESSATEIKKLFRNNDFNMIIFYASLEHMTHDERMISIKDSWEILKEGNYLSIIETPNRLWYYDHHTSLLPFFMWLPDDLAYKYAKYSPRDNFRELYEEFNDSLVNHFLRRGRGISFHELELCIKEARKLKVISSKTLYHRSFMSYLVNGRSQEYKYESFLHQSYPDLHKGFFHSDLDLIIQKD